MGIAFLKHHLNIEVHIVRDSGGRGKRPKTVAAVRRTSFCDQFTFKAEDDCESDGERVIF